MGTTSTAEGIIACPLCQSEEWSLIDRVRPDDLAYLYQHRFGISIADYLRDLKGVSEITFHDCRHCSLRYFYPPVAGSHHFYTCLNQFDWYYLADKAEYQRAASLIPPGARVLDVGCGNGKFAGWVRECEYVGLEINLPAGEPAGEKRPIILPELVQDHSRRNPGGYDVVCSFQVLEHVVDVSGFIDDCLRCLRPGGILILSVPAADSFVSQTVNGLLNLPPHHLSWWPDATLAYLPRRYSLVLTAIIHEPLERIHYRWYSFNWAQSLAAPLVGRRWRLIDRSFAHSLRSGLLLPVALVRWLFLFIQPRPAAGHSVVAVYRKSSSD